MVCSVSILSILQKRVEIQEDDVDNDKDLIEVEETDLSLGKLKLKAL